ncbi:MAG TPA: alkaline phosphatase family protein [Vicinamibacterales bacterium]
MIIRHMTLALAAAAFAATATLAGSASTANLDRPLFSDASRLHDDRDRDDNARVGHVFVIVLENEGFDTTFGPSSKAPYLSKTLTSQGALLAQYYGTGHASLDNYIAMISGQAATPETRNDCQVFSEFALTGFTPDGQAIGHGCVYPDSVKTLPDQLDRVGKTWRAYMGDMGNDPARESAVCGHPALNAVDLTQSAEAPSAAVPAGDQYAARHNPFVYFHSIIDSPQCDRNVVNLNRLTEDLKSERSTPDLVFVTPNLCDDGHDGPCVNGQPGGLVSADRFLQKWIPQIMASQAYKRNGLIVIAFDEGGLSVTPNPGGGFLIFAPGAFCCNEQAGPNLAPFPQSAALGPYTLTFQSYGGDRTGAVLLSPLLKPGTVAYTPFNHFSLLKSLEDIFDTDEHLGYAGQPGLLGFFGAVKSDILLRD